MSSPADVNSNGSTSSSSTPAAAASAAATAAVVEETCHTPGCSNVAKQSCPTCIELKVSPVSRYCSQECFKSSWKDHNLNVHKRKSICISVQT